MCSLSLFSLYLEVATGGVYENIHVEKPVLESLFNKAGGLRSANLSNRDSNTGISLRLLQSF